MQIASEKLPGKPLAKVAWITGGGSGIGRSLAFALRDAGWEVVISGRNEERLHNTLRTAGSRHLHTYPIDVTDQQAISKAADWLNERFGGVDLAVLNAGDYSPMRLNEFDLALFHKLISVNYLGVVNCLAALLPGMRRRGGGEILITASLSGYCGLPGAAPYGASKAALINMAESLQPELMREGICLRLINPGFVESELTRKNDFKMPFLMTPDQAALEIMKRLSGSGFEIAFPKGFTLIMKFVRCLPYRLYFLLMQRLLK